MEIKTCSSPKLQRKKNGTEHPRPFYHQDIYAQILLHLALIINTAHEFEHRTHQGILLHGEKTNLTCLPVVINKRELKGIYKEGKILCGDQGLKSHVPLRNSKGKKNGTEHPRRLLPPGHLCAILLHLALTINTAHEFEHRTH
ncbi:hypothetical protein CDAR_368911 [Caerostris darwini]|uniref:Uncharacterized protein n=1 Tax=Caerostris darwini TaxID=1538125 RepID=A0AAV4NHR8_9ARAC|nr:hypothetical protein CDAR_368911 [Caerostris darwini]